MCILPEKAHHKIPALKRFESLVGTTISPPAGYVDPASAGSASQHPGNHGNNIRTTTTSPNSRRSSVHHNASSLHRHRRKQKIVPRIILKPLKPPPASQATTATTSVSSSQSECCLCYLSVFERSDISVYGLANASIYSNEKRQGIRPSGIVQGVPKKTER